MVIIGTLSCYAKRGLINNNNSNDFPFYNKQTYPRNLQKFADFLNLLTINMAKLAGSDRSTPFRHSYKPSNPNLPNILTSNLSNRFSVANPLGVGGGGSYRC